ncbi:unknown [Prevotella sp. CAG:487]|nr:unknown [Prevotella sp. CAG:487]
MDNSSDIITWLFLFLVSLKIKFPHLYFLQIRASQIIKVNAISHSYIYHIYAYQPFIHLHTAGVMLLYDSILI